MADTTLSGPDTAGVVAPPPILMFAPLIVGLLLQRLRPARLLPPALSFPLGWALIGGAGALHVWFGWTMTRARTPINVSKPTVRLITDGPFRVSRNPSYLAFVGHYLGVTCLVNSRWPLLLLPLAILLVQGGAIEREERYLARRFGQPYRPYRARVRRWI